MDDYGIQARTIEPARGVAKYLSDKPVGLLASKLCVDFDLHGGFDDVVAREADELFLKLRDLDADNDGHLSPVEVGTHADLVDELFQALATNDRGGEIPTWKDLAGTPVSKQQADHALGKTTAAPIVRPCLDLGRRALVLVLWTGRGARYAFDRSRALIEAIRPDAVMLHTDAWSLARGGGEALTKDILKAYPWLRILWAIQGDAYGPDPSRPWTACAREADRLGIVESLMFNCEVSWKRLARGETIDDRCDLARRCVTAPHNAAPSLHFSFTTYDGLVAIQRPDGKGWWGGHNTFPARGFVGEGSPILASTPQVYIAASATPERPANKAHAANRYGREAKSCAKAREMGIVGPQIEDWLYLQGHHTDASGIAYLAQQRRVTCVWYAPGVSTYSVAGLAAAQKLMRLPGCPTVKEFQAQYGLDDDNWLGEKSLKVLDQIVV